MPTFMWEGRTRGGELRKGVADAADKDTLVHRLREQSITVTNVRKKPREISIKLGTGVGHKDIVVFTRQFATMIASGLPLVQCLDILSAQSDNKAFAKILFDVKESVESGSSFSDALRRHPKVFNDLFVNMVQAGEIGGVIDTILERVAQYLEKAMKLRSKIKGAMVYPIAIALVAVTVIVVLLWKVIPTFENMFRDMGAGALPAPTQIVMSISQGFVANVHFIGLFALAAFVTFTMSMRTRQGKRFFHGLLLKIPIIGPTLRKSIVARFTRTFGTLLSSGVPILDSMEICAHTSGNVVVEDAIMSVRARVAEGKDVGGPLAATRVFPPMVVQMIGVGEQTGNMDTMLQKIADFYEEEVDVAVDALTSLMEPIMMVGLGGIVGFIMIAMYMPIFELAGSIKGG